jgi:phosphoenolpyruvate synthase/pyruvate phosphate dikinase
MDGLPVTIRTIDPPLHEFLPEQYAPRCAHRFNPYFGRWSIRSSNRFVIAILV